MIEEVKLSNNGKPIKPTNPNQTPNQGGRPPKAGAFIDAMEEVLNDGLNAIIMTDEELFILANDKLEEDNKIGYSTFKQYKASNSETENEIYDRFLAVYKKALIREKNSLFTNMTKDNPQWQKFAWIIERKFSDWNLKTISENKNENSGEITFTFK